MCDDPLPSRQRPRSRTPITAASAHRALSTQGFFLPLDFAALVRAEEYTLDAPLLLACADGSRSAAACASLRAAGFDRATALDGGLAAWEAEGFALLVEEDGEDGLVGAWV